MRKMVVILALTALAMAAPGEFSLEKPFDVRLDLDPQMRQVRLRVLKSAQLEVTVPKGVQRLPLESMESELNPQARGSVLVQDFDFDGRKDIAVPTGIGYGGVNVFYDVYRYQAKANRWVAIPARGDEFSVCNPELLSKQKVLLTNSRSGPFWYGRDYKFRQGTPWLYRQRNPILLEALAKDSELATHFEVFEGPGKLLRSCMSSNESEIRPLEVVLAQDVQLLAGPGSAETKGTLGAGQRVKLDRVQRHNSKLYAEAKSDKLSGWVALPSSQ